MDKPSEIVPNRTKSNKLDQTKNKHQTILDPHQTKRKTSPQNWTKTNHQSLVFDVTVTTLVFQNPKLLASASVGCAARLLWVRHCNSCRRSIRSFGVCGDHGRTGDTRGNSNRSHFCFCCFPLDDIDFGRVSHAGYWAERASSLPCRLYEVQSRAGRVVTVGFLWDVVKSSLITSEI